MYKYLILLTLLSCGIDVNHNATGVVTVKHEINLKIDDLIQAFKDECTKQYTSQTDIDECVSKKLESLVELLNNLSRGIK